jgi:very-short-patch-repair endonuclease
VKQTSHERQEELISLLLFQIKALVLPEPVREFKFHSTRQFRADLGWPGQRLLLELQGGTHNRGAHVRGVRYEEDCERMAEAVYEGWRVIWVTSKMVEDGRAVAWLERLLKRDAVGRLD